MRPKSWTENKLLEVHFYGKESLIVFQTSPSLRKTKTESLPHRKQLSVFICFLAARRQGQCRALRLVRENAVWWTRGELLLHFARQNHMLATTAAQNASVTAKTPHRGVNRTLMALALPLEETQHHMPLVLEITNA